MSSRQITLYHTPVPASGAVALLEALGADSPHAGAGPEGWRQPGPGLSGHQPDGQVPAIVHNGALVTEQVAIYLYLADLYPEARLAPPIGDALRGYLRWMAFYGACFEPAMIDKAMHREPPRA